MSQYVVRGTTVADNPTRLDITAPGVKSQLSPYGKAMAEATIPHSATTAKLAGTYTAVPKAIAPSPVKSAKATAPRVVASSMRAFKAMQTKSK